MVTTARYVKPRQTRRAKAPGYSGFDELANELENVLSFRGKEAAQVLGGKRPVGTEELPPVEQYKVLEALGMNLSARYWPDPQAIRDLYRLRKQFFPQTASEALLVYARAAEKTARLTPDLRVTPADPEFKQQARRLGVEVE